MGIVFVEVYVATSLAVCEARDPKGHYARARRGELQAFTGNSDSYEPPDLPELRLNTEGSPEMAALEVREIMKTTGVVPSCRRVPD